MLLSFRRDQGASLSPLTHPTPLLYAATFQLGYQQPAGFDRTRNYVIGKKDVELEHLEEAYTTENWLVRIYKVLEPANRPKIKYTERQIRSKRTKSTYPKKVTYRFPHSVNSPPNDSSLFVG